MNNLQNMSSKKTTSSTIRWAYHYIADGFTGLQDRFLQHEIDDGFLVSKDSTSGDGKKQFALFDNWKQFQNYEKDQKKRGRIPIIMR